MTKPLFPLKHIYLMYFVLYAAGMWGLFSYFTLAYLYFTVTHAVFFWLPALTIFLPATIALIFHGPGSVAVTMLMAVVYSILFWLTIFTLLRFVLLQIKPGKKPHRKKARVRS